MLAMIWWHRVRSSVSWFIVNSRTLLRRVYWACAISALIAVFAIPLTVTMRNPDVQAIIHGDPMEFIRERDRYWAPIIRENRMLNDFVFMVNHLFRNYPFFEMAVDSTGLDYIDLAIDAMEELYGYARYNVAGNFFIDFLNERYINMLGGFGNPRVTAEARNIAAWISEPYFFGLYDWRFYSELFDLYVRDDNAYTTVLADGIAYMRINTFLPKGYEPVTRYPFWHFDFDGEKQRLLDFYGSVYDFDHLIIDIRGIGDGFGDYFLPLILAPNLHEPLNRRFYAFQMAGDFTSRVSYGFRNWYGLGEPVDKALLSQGFAYDLPEDLVYGFPIDIMARPLGDAAFGGQVWLITDSDNFSGANFMYLQMARDAGFVIVYEENPLAIGWATSFARLRNSGLSLRYNPLYFTDDTGRPLERYGLDPHHRLSTGTEGFEEILALVSLGPG